MQNPIAEYMTRAVHTIGLDQPAKGALSYMLEHDIRHLPVLKGGEVVGIVSERDLQFLFAFSDVNQDNVTVEEAMSPDVYCTDQQTSLKEVVTTMADSKIGSAIVMSGHDVAGIFTTVDALRILADLD